MINPDLPSKAFLLGVNISKSISPSVQNAAFARMKIDAKYELCDLKSETLGHFLSSLDLNGVLGFNVTAPFKQEIIGYLSSIDDRSRMIGAVNTIAVNKKTKEMRGFNTDYDGVLASLEKLDLSKSSKEMKVNVIGSGGAARACILALINSGYTNIKILNRTIEKAKIVSEHFATLFPKIAIEVVLLSHQNFRKSLQDCSLAINAISASRFPIVPDFSEAEDTRVFDLGYKGDSLFLEAAKKKGLRSFDGLLMLVVQAAKSFEIWTGKKAPMQTMMRAAKVALGRV
jgi:shikimate dehydrogenase